MSKYRLRKDNMVTYTNSPFAATEMHKMGWTVWPNNWPQK
jgi:hypothetical protein